MLTAALFMLNKNSNNPNVHQQEAGETDCSIFIQGTLLINKTGGGGMAETHLT